MKRVVHSSDRFHRLTLGEGSKAKNLIFSFPLFVLLNRLLSRFRFINNDLEVCQKSRSTLTVKLSLKTKVPKNNLT
jgi:hypothetical protein